MISHFNHTGKVNSFPLILHHMTIHEYLRNKYIRQNTTAMLKDGKWYRYIGGAWVPEKQFQLMFPLPGKIGNNSNNPNSRVSYLD